MNHISVAAFPCQCFPISLLGFCKASSIRVTVAEQLPKNPDSPNLGDSLLKNSNCFRELVRPEMSQSEDLECRRMTQFLEFLTNLQSISVTVLIKKREAFLHQIGRST